MIGQLILITSSSITLVVSRQHRVTIPAPLTITARSVEIEQSRSEDVKMLALTLSLLLTTVQSMPQQQLRKISVAAGEKLVLHCALENENNNVVIWKKSDRVLFAGNIRVRHDERLQAVDSILTVDSVLPEDEGSYSCEMEDSAGVFKMYSQTVLVLQPPSVKISQVGGYLAVKQATNLALTCVGVGVPQPEIVWRKGSRIMSRGVGEAGVLLEYVTREDAGDIVCEASNGVGEVARDVLTLDVLYAPEVEMIQPHVSFQPKCGLELQCVVHSSSTPTVQWRHNDLLLHPGDGVTIWSLDNLHVLQISRCDHHILGEFVCKAENNLGQADTSVLITKNWLDQKISDILTEEETNSNNVRRNVEHSEALPLVSSSSSSLFSVALLISSTLALVLL